MKEIVTFRALADNSVVALCDNHKGMSVDVDKVNNYMKKMQELTGGTDVEFNNTFRQICKDRVFYTFEPADCFSVEKKPYLPRVVECVLLSDDTVMMNIDGKIVNFSPEDGNTMYATKDDALEAMKCDVAKKTSDYIDYLFEARKELKDILKSLNGHIDEALEFKKNVVNL